ncbi:MAG: Tyrosine-tRNA ligase [Candidatus Amesbacteria bacterium GW2011_GWA2_47_11b]|uniref:Tyrosine--tRNA ligase n=2 Tax=Candidatus Amesiibacteriota TaxID=1752730 RepID=A0A0G1SE34_9BACT|nr:MAG: Tyrosine-tRNA ligase [Candidatus Amesbacteria bacterium GW2011_GWA2_47_11b]KKU67691.1 MAG: Tyrosine-tRNA ligase [Candidatus Amesbacteria bacterium GW2011_GWA1_47_20]
MDKIDELLTRGVDKIYPTKEALKKVLSSGKKIRLYTGIDPTGSEIHIGHTAWMWKLRAFQDAGHEVIVLIGDFTGMIGDPSGKSDTRKPLTREQVLENAKSYKQQIGKIIRFDGENAAQIKFNSEWHSKMSLLEMARLMHHLTIAQVIERDMFQNRLKEGKDLFMSEFFYPFFQGYDSVAMDVDLEVGGSDQMFNMMTGRDLMKKINGKEKFVMTLKLITDSSGNKIGKTEGNAIAITGKPEALFGQIMSLPDEVISAIFESCTNLPLDQIPSGGHPMELKKKLAWQIVSQYNDEMSADNAQKHFETTVQAGELPSDVSQISVKSPNIVDVLVESGLAPSKSEAKRLIDQKGVKVNNETVTSISYLLTPDSIVSVGSRKFVKIK